MPRTPQFPFSITLESHKPKNPAWPVCRDDAITPQPRTMPVRPAVSPINDHEVDLFEDDDDAPTLEFSMSKLAPSLLMKAAAMHVDATPVPSPARAARSAA